MSVKKKYINKKAGSAGPFNRSGCCSGIRGIPGSRLSGRAWGEAGAGKPGYDGKPLLYGSEGNDPRKRSADSVYRFYLWPALCHSFWRRGGRIKPFGYVCV